MKQIKKESGSHKTIYELRIGSYFEKEVIIFSDLKELIIKINQNPDKHIRVDSKYNRVLLAPEQNKYRKIEGLESLYYTYLMFNDTNIPLSSVTVGENGPGSYYINNQ